MKRKNIIVVTLLILSGLFTMQSCTKVDDVTPVIKQAFTTPVCSTIPAVRSDGTVFFTGTTVDLTWESTNTGGDPVKWDVYFGPGKSPALFQEDVNGNSVSVPVLDGQTYYWKVVISDSRGIVTSSTVNTFIAVNGTNAKIKMALTTATDVLSAIGVDLEPDDVVDLRLLIYKKSDMSVVNIIDDGVAAEDFTGFATLPDGDYVVGVDIFSTLDAGDINSTVTLDLALKFSQLGMIDTTLDFPAVMTNYFNCSDYKTLLATVTKAGPVYTVERSISYLLPDAPPALEGTWFGSDEGYTSEVVTTIVAGKLFIDGVGIGWMWDGWGEISIGIVPAEITVNTCAGTLDIPKQAFMTTTWLGDEQPVYSIKGSGTYDLSGAYPVIKIKYDFIQDGGAGALARYFGLPYFTLDITLDPAGKGVISTSGTKGAGLPIRPVRTK